MVPLPLSVTVAALLAAAQPPAAEPWELLKYAPPQANSVLTINVHRLLASPRAEKDGWAKLDHTAFLAGAIPVGPTIERIVVAKALEPAAPGHGAAVAILPTRSNLDLAALGQKLGGTPVTIGGEPALQTPNGGLLVPLATNVLGAAWGKSKPQLASWVRGARTADKSPLSRLLTSTVADTAGRHHISLVVDTTDLIDPARVAAAVTQMEALKTDLPTADRLKAYLNGLQTVTLTANVADRGLVTRVALTSSALPNGIPPDLMKGFLMEVLDRNGARLEDFPAATAGVSGRTFHFDFRLSDPELARITHLFLPPLPGATDAAAIPVAPAGATAEATGRFFRAVNQQVDTLRRKLPGSGNDEVAAVWYDSAANAIASATRLGADPAVVDYGMSTAGRLRAIADSLRGLPIKLAELEDKAYLYSFGGGGWGWGWGWHPWGGMQQVQTNLPEIRAKQIETIRKDEANRLEVWKQIDAQRSDVRGAMATKFGVDPDKAGR